MLIIWLLFFNNQAEAQIVDVVREVQRIDSMRKSLVAGVQGPVNRETFKAVCAPVGKEAKKIALEKKWKFRQASRRFRNPLNKATAEEIAALKAFQSDKALKSFWKEIDGKNHYFQKITVQQQCLNCHGSREKRPDFILRQYPEDKAFGFKVGDMRGTYHVTFD